VAASLRGRHALDRLPRQAAAKADAFHLIAGRKGQGKGTLLAAIAARVTRGELVSKCKVVWIGSEDSAAIDIRPRIEAAEGDPKRVLVVKRGWIQLPRDIDEISRAITDFGDVGMLLIDPVGNHISGKSSDADTDIRDAIAPLNKLADEHELMIFGVRHLSEKECARGVLAAILGASAWVHVHRAVLAVARDNENAGVSHVQCVAGNRLPPNTPGRMFRIEAVHLPGLENEVTHAVWIGDSSKDVEEMLSSKRESGSARARTLILQALQEQGGWSRTRSTR
jgi:AAA domain